MRGRKQRGREGGKEREKGGRGGGGGERIKREGNKRFKIHFLFVGDASSNEDEYKPSKIPNLLPENDAADTVIGK